MMHAAAGIVFDGVAYGSLLFLISVGLSVTMGLMGFINLAHGAFAMLGGYLTVWLMNDLRVPFAATLPVVVIAVGIVGAAAERFVFRRLYGGSQLDQVLLTIGVVFMATAAATFVWGPSQQSIHLPALLSGRLRLAGVEIGAYRLFLVALVTVLSLVLRFLVERTRLGAQVRAAVDAPQVAEGLGVAVGAIFTLTFAVASGLAGLGGALGIEVLGLDPTFPLKYMVYFLLVVSVGGAGAVVETALASVGLGLLDVLGKYYVPRLGAFVIYGSMVLLLLAFPAGLRRRRA
jgi:branched-chain amino acid transport system permease protein